MHKIDGGSKDLDIFINEYIAILTYRDLIWEVMGIVEEKNKRRDKIYSDFWIITVRAYAASLFLGINKFFDRRSDCPDFSRLINALNRENVSERYDMAKETWQDEYQGFRHKIFAHTNSEFVKQEGLNSAIYAPIEEIFRNEEMALLLKEIECLLSAIYYNEYGKVVYWESLFTVIDDLREITKTVCIQPKSAGVRTIISDPMPITFWERLKDRLKRYVP